MADRWSHRAVLTLSFATRRACAAVVATVLSLGWPLPVLIMLTAAAAFHPALVAATPQLAFDVSFRNSRNSGGHATHPPCPHQFDHAAVAVGGHAGHSRPAAVRRGQENYLAPVPNLLALAIPDDVERR